MVKFKKIKTKILEVSRPRSPVFKLVRDLYVINTWFKFEDKITVFTRNHTDNDADDNDDRTKNNVSP